MQNRLQIALAITCCILALLASCAETPPSTVFRTAYSIPANHPGFRNILVIGVAGDFESRALFEQQLVAAIAGETVTATPYFAVVGRRPMLTRTALRTAIRAREFDAVILTRQQGQEKEELAPLRPVGGQFDLFDYDYAELNLDVSIAQAPAITFVTEMYSAVAEEKVWSINSLSFDKATATDLINEQALMIAAQLKKDGLLAR